MVKLESATYFVALFNQFIRFSGLLKRIGSFSKYVQLSNNIIVQILATSPIPYSPSYRYICGGDSEPV